MSNQTPSRLERKQTKKEQKKSKHTKLIVFLSILVILLFGFLYVGHQVHELTDAQRQTNTILDKPIKNTVVKIVQPKLPEEIRPQVVKIIQEEPLYRIQQAADNPALFQQIADKYQVPENYVAPAKQYWFSQQNTALRSDIYHAKLMQIISELQALNNSNS
ncbi:hypothetical protein [Lentilactobacillus kefiri]|uniref:Uncharacterized protein n=2 Tax=Lentilactobacillus kefiri TaxID=33962 RepID=A0A8E1RJ05_LENKE|nr:hypothetical protein [Lentilactobacillus kefiri]KRL56247.1 hypothetical protein FD08_GL004240 [Lentilactobacillus parakefiri DSM 10551]KRM51627.1 hypothetical protein FC95_GL001460 [Lentilactobacillus kefiri DSM 20587 = JCM 5818]MCJ2162779.1 hypothetical protein [Lentilactobacillus kefiri]MCP9370040.1 hypothetical protein [Lentilactobacillus kefiri]MDH5109549.1 hypothetical protein [Lentilactobacillus kefiri]